MILSAGTDAEKPFCCRVLSVHAWFDSLVRVKEFWGSRLLVPVPARVQSLHRPMNAQMRFLLVWLHVALQFFVPLLRPTPALHCGVRPAQWNAAKPSPCAGAAACMRQWVLSLPP